MVAGRARRAAGQIIEVLGRVIDLAGHPAPNAQLEIWQANAAGRYAHPSDDNPAPLDPNFQGYARLRTTADGGYRIVTVKPGPYPGARRGMRTPHVHIDLSGRVDRLVTQIYFPEEPLNATDALLSANIRPAMVIAAAAGVKDERQPFDHPSSCEAASGKGRRSCFQYTQNLSRPGRSCFRSPIV